MLKLNVGSKAIDFTLTATDGKEITLSSYFGKKNIVLYFYPKDSTPGCTKEACSFRDLSSEFAKVDTVILGVSVDSVKSHVNFTEKNSLNFPLLADTEKKVVEDYGVWQEKTRCGKTSFGIARSTFLIGKDGEIKKVWENVSVEGHVEEILDSIKNIL